MEERVPEKKQKGVLAAAAMIREEILGPQKQVVSMEGSLEHILLASMTSPGQISPDDAPPLLEIETSRSGYPDPDEPPENSPS